MSKHKFHTDGKKIVVCTTHFHGNIIKGVAKCSDEDKFDLERGMELAKARCEYNYYIKKREWARYKLDRARMFLDSAKIEVNMQTNYFDDTCDDCSEAYQTLAILENRMAK